jgi:hypothetical protein
MTIPIDYNKMQKELDRRHYMGQIYTGKYETWQATELGFKTYGKWCNLVGWKNLTGQNWHSDEDFLNLAIRRRWAEIVYDFGMRDNVAKQTKFGYDLFKTFEYWIDEKAQKNLTRKKQVNSIMGGFQKILQGMPKFMQQVSAMMASLAPPEQTKTRHKFRRKRNRTRNFNNENFDGNENRKNGDYNSQKSRGNMRKSEENRDFW